MDKKTEEAMIKYFKENGDTVWAASCDGRFDIIVSFWAKNMAYLTNVLLDFQKRFGEYILERQLATIIYGEYFVRDYLIDSKPSEYRKSFFKATSEERKRTLMEYCRMNSNIVYIVKCLGQWDFEIDIEVENTEKFREILMKFKTTFSDIIK